MLSTLRSIAFVLYVLLAIVSFIYMIAQTMTQTYRIYRESLETSKQRSLTR